MVYLRSGTDASRLAMTPAREFPARWASKFNGERGEGLVMPWAGLASRTSPRNPPQPGDESEGQLTRRLSWVCRPLLVGNALRGGSHRRPSKRAMLLKELFLRSD